jgi:hypothetical protein
MQERVRGQLVSELEIKKRVWERARVCFADVIANAEPRLTQNPKEILTIQTAGAVMKFRANEYMDALKEFKG